MEKSAQRNPKKEQFQNTALLSWIELLISPKLLKT